MQSPGKRTKAPTLRARLALVLATFALVPAISLGVSILLVNNAWNQTTGIKQIETAATQAGLQVANLMQVAENTAFVLARDTLLQNAHKAFTSGTTLDAELDYYNEIKRLLKFVNFNNDFYNIRVFLPDSNIATQEGISLFGLKSLDKTRLPADMQSGQLKYGWSAVHEYTSFNTLAFNQQVAVVTFYYTILSVSVQNEEQSVIAVDVATERLTEILRGFSAINGIWGIMNSQGQLITLTCSEPEWQDTRENRLLAVGQNSNTERTASASRQDVFQTIVPIQGSDWQIVVLIPSRQFRKLNLATILATILVSLLILGTIPLISSYTARNFIREINELKAHMLGVRQGIYKPVPVDATTREIQMLQECHNSMVETVDTLINNVYEERFARQEAQMTSLFEQVKPHFLYNALENAKWLALRENAPELRHFIDNLAAFFRLSLSKGNDWVPLDQEFEHVRAYIAIMNTRLHDRILYEYELNDDARHLMVLKLILQPLVENAIIHGICEKEEPRGLIRLEASRVGDQIRISITDDGIGIDPEVLARINSNQAEGFGISNVFQRMRLYYQDNCSLQFENLPDQGSRATLLIPVLDQTSREKNH